MANPTLIMALAALVMSLRMNVAHTACNKNYQLARTNTSLAINTNEPTAKHQRSSSSTSSSSPSSASPSTTITSAAAAAASISTTKSHNFSNNQEANLPSTSHLAELEARVNSTEINPFDLKNQDVNKELPVVSLDYLNDFRLEYNKYKILSHLGLTGDPNELSPMLDDDLRSKLTASNTFADSDRQTSTRRKRSLSCDQVKGNKDACCLENFYVNFTHIGWDKWILYPAGYNANYCHGQCDLSHARYYHSTLLSKYSNVISLCCSPKQMAPLRLLYIDEENKVHQKTIPDMVVESCDCA